MIISQSILRELLYHPELKQDLLDAESILSSDENLITTFCGRSNIIDESFDGVDTLYYPTSVSFDATVTP